MSYEYFEFKREEFEDRLAKLRHVMEDQHLDVVILTEEENVRWVTGYWVFTMQDHFIPTVVIVSQSAKEEPVLFISEEGTGEKLACIGEVRYWEEGKVSYLDADKGKMVADCLSAYDLQNKRIGCELGNGMRLNLDQGDIDFIREALTTIQFVDVSRLMWDLRSVKSVLEIAKIRKACQITTWSMGEGFAMLKTGITERRLGQYLVEKWFSMGATGISHVGVSFGAYAIFFAHCDPKEYPLRKGEVVKVDIGCTFEGYRCDMYRMACLGKPGDDEQKVADTISEANQSVISDIKAGVTCSHLYKKAHDVFKRNSLEHLLSPQHYVGHGIGLGIHEPPYVYPDNESELQAGMVLSIEPWTMDRNNLSLCMNVEDVVVVKEDGCEVLTEMDRSIRIVEEQEG